MSIDMAAIQVHVMEQEMSYNMRATRHTNPTNTDEIDGENNRLNRKTMKYTTIVPKTTCVYIIRDVQNLRAHSFKTATAGGIVDDDDDGDIRYESVGRLSA